MVFTDIVGSTERAAELGDRAWRDLWCAGGSVRLARQVARCDAQVVDGAQSSKDDGGPPVSGPAISPAPRSTTPRHLTAFLFADIRGYTQFTERHGAEAASRLAAAFISLAREVAASHGAQLRGSWGDQVLVELDSPRDALRAAAELQRRCMDAAIHDPTLPLLVGVGLDIGEAAEAGDGTSARGLNIAARLCAHAGPGQVLATAELVHTAGAVAGQSYVDQGRTRLKGLAEPARVVLVRPNEDRERDRRFQAVVDRQREQRRRRRLRAWVAVLTAAAVVAALGAAWGVQRLTRAESVVVPPGGVAVLDPDSGRLVDAVPVGGVPEGVSAATGAIWVTGGRRGALARIDPSSGRVSRTVVAGSPVAVAATDRDLWTVNGTDRFVHRINTDVNREVDQIEVGNQPVAITAGAGAVWVTSKVDNTLTRIDPRSGRATGTAEVGRGPAGLAISGRTVWVANSRDGTVSPVDARTLQVGAPIVVGAGPRGIVAVVDGVWVVNSLELTVSHIDARRREEVGTVRVGESPVGVVAAGGSVWVSVSGEGSMVRIDPARDRVTATVRLGAAPYGVAATDGRLWVATRPFASAAHIGGTLTIAAEDLPVYDPALGTAPPHYYLGVYDGLVAMRKVDGIDGYDLVPDLAQSQPRATEGGKTYTFTIRPGIRYSDGRPLKPADFRRGITRTFTAPTPGGPGSPDLFAGLVGGRHCLENPGSCDLSAGITTGAHTVTFHLTVPDPNFVYRLALSHASPAPPGSPTDAVTATNPIPGTGPYAITAVTAGKSALLTRNRFFQPWSAAAQPSGYPDRIRIVSMNGTQATNAVLDGTADVVYHNEVPQARRRALELNHPDLLHRDRLAFTWYLQPNTFEPPFDNVYARRAISYAVDHRRFLGGYGSGGDPTCQLLPPGFPGFAPRCPYTTNPDAAGGWHGPDMTRARQLVRRSGTEGDAVLIWWHEALAVEGRYLAGVLRRLGYDVRLRLLVNEDYWPGAFDPGTHKNVTGIGWIADWPSPANYLQDLLACGNLPRMYCNPALDRLMASAFAQQERDPALADRLWRQASRVAVDDAAMIPLINGDQVVLVSERVGNYQSSDMLGPLFDQMWVK